MLIILNFLLIFAGTGLLTSLLGYWIHRAFHQEWSGLFYRSHLNHHKIQYPPYDFVSDKYRYAGKDSTVILFAAVFAPLIIGIIVLGALGILPLAACISVLVGLAFWGQAHNYIHDQFHITNNFWSRFAFFRKWRNLHYIHHLNNQVNMGIICFIWDRLFGTFHVENEDTQI